MSASTASVERPGLALMTSKSVLSCSIHWMYPPGSVYSVSCTDRQGSCNHALNNVIAFASMLPSFSGDRVRNNRKLMTLNFPNKSSGNGVVMSCNRTLRLAGSHAEGGTNLLETSNASISARCPNSSAISIAQMLISDVSPCPPWRAVGRHTQSVFPCRRCEAVGHSAQY